MIYFVRCDVTGLTKIGWTGGGLGASRSAGGVWARLRSFQTSCSTPLRVVSVVDGSRSDESDLHRRHADQCDHGEWFRDVVAPPTAYPLDGFRDDVCTKPLPTVDPAAMMKACVECGAAFREKARTRPNLRCKPCRGWYALALAASGAARRARKPPPRPIVGAVRLLADAKPTGPRPANVCALARDIGRDVGAHWHLVYRVLRGLRGGADPVGRAVLAHPLARAA